MKTLSTIAIVLGLVGTANAELKTPQESPHATVQQTIGLTVVTVDYHRPAVAGRPIWGKLVPYGEVWRAGANENTTITFSTDVKIAGKPLRAGTYGLHTLPTAKDWTVMFSTVASAWGSYTYDQKEDALRITVTPRATAQSEERLLYRFDDPSMTKASLTLAWEKLSISIPIEVETPKVVMASMRAELRGSANFTAEGWAQAAGYWLKNGGNLDEALKMADKSIQMQPGYANHMARATILEKKGNAAGAKEARAAALVLATENDLNQAAYRLMGEKKVDEAVALFQSIAQKYPASWNAHDSLAEALATKGDKAGAIAAYEKALGLAKDPVQKKRITATIAKLKT
ncbi:MAG: DUF2911 domain-containing protein [Kofleriaceae bacterium]